MADPGAALPSQVIRGYWASQIIGTLAQLEIADHLANGPERTASQYSELLGGWIEA
jgi:hypothetical protein